MRNEKINKEKKIMPKTKKTPAVEGRIMNLPPSP